MSGALRNLPNDTGEVTRGFKHERVRGKGEAQDGAVVVSMFKRELLENVHRHMKSHP